MCLQEVEGKTLEEVTEYSKVFWERYKELHESEKVSNTTSTPVRLVCQTGRQSSSANDTACPEELLRHHLRLAGAAAQPGHA